MGKTAMKIAVSVVLVFVSLVPPAGGQTEGGEDPIRAHLREAKETYVRTFSEARSKLLQAFDEAGELGRAKKQAFVRLQPPVGLRTSDRRTATSPYELDAYTGRYLLASGDVLSVIRYDDRLFLRVPGVPPVKLVPMEGNSFARSDNGVQHDFLMGEAGLAVEVHAHGITQTAQRIDPSGTQVIRIEAQVDGRSLLVLRGNTAQWLHREHVVPGRHRQAVKPTVFNGVEWYPVWPDANGLENHGSWESDTLTGLESAVPRAEVPARLVSVRTRCPVHLRERPGPENDYATVIDFDDYHGGSGDYVIELHFPPAAASGPESVAAGVRGDGDPAAIPSGGLVAWYPFDGSARDRSGNGHHGEVHHATLTRDRFDRPERAYNFQGNSYIEVSPPPRRLPNASLAVSVWAYYVGFSGGWLSNVIACQNDDVDRVFQLVCVNRQLAWLAMGKEWLHVRSHIRARPNVWYHVAAVFDGKTHRLYVDGVPVAAREGSLLAKNTQSLVIGKKSSDEPWSFFDGTIDDLRIYNRALTDGEVRALYHEGGFEPDPLTKAARLGLIAAVKKLVGGGVDVDSRDKQGRSALHYAALRRDLGLVQFLLSRKANAEITTVNGDTPAHTATSRGDAEIVRLLLEGGASADAENRLRQRPLHVASALGRTGIVRLLIEKGAEVNAKDTGQNTPLHRAAMYGHREVAEILLANGADPAAATKRSWPPFECARRMGHDELAEFLAAKWQSLKRTVIAPRLRAKPVLDGTVSAGEYGAPAPQADFVLLRTGGKRSLVETGFHAAWHAGNLYLAIIADEDNAEAILTPKRGRDGDIWRDDYVDIFIDTNFDHKSYFQFATNLNGERYDARCGPGCPKWGDLGWSVEWRVVGKAKGDRYVLELEIPFQGLETKVPEPGEVWGLNIGRGRSPLTVGAEHQEHSQWSMTPKDYHQPYYFGVLKFGGDDLKGGAR